MEDVLHSMGRIVVNYSKHFHMVQQVVYYLIFFLGIIIKKLNKVACHMYLTPTHRLKCSEFFSSGKTWEKFC
jgi:hypothetical protein